MIDIHTHILPGIDDGAGTLEESVRMLRIAAGTGTTDVVASPHANFDYPFDPLLLDDRIAEVQLASDAAVRVHRGCDLHLSPENIENVLAAPSRYTINRKNYLLVEFPDVLIARDTDAVFARMIEAGIVPVITHPERNFLLHGRLAELKDWAAAGCRIQVTAQSFFGRFGTEPQRFCRRLMKECLVHFVASDAHGAHDRTPQLDEARAHVEHEFGPERAALLFETNPRAVLCGQPLPEQPKPEPSPGRKWFRFWASSMTV